MRIQTLEEVAATRMLTMEALAADRAHWIAMTGGETFPVTAEEVNWTINQYNAVHDQLEDYKTNQKRVLQFITQHAIWSADGKTRTMQLDGEQINALVSMLRGVSRSGTPTEGRIR